MLFNDTFDVLDNFMNNFSDSYFMATDIVENDKAYLLTIDMPGVKKEDINIEIENDKLTISVKSNKDDENLTYIKKEIFASDYTRSYVLKDCDNTNVSAKLENGLLMVIVGKKIKEETKNVIKID